MNDSVYLLWHVHRDNKDADDAKLIGVYRTHADAEAAIRRVGKQPGFCDHPAGMQIEPYELNKDHWIEGFVTVEKAKG